MPRIKSIKYIGKRQTYNIEMKSSFHNYLIEGCVSKNSHSAAYGLIAYQTAYLKANYYREYMCSLLDGVVDDDDKKEKYISELLEDGVMVLPPKINDSTLRYEINKDKNIVFPFSAIKGLGSKACEKLIKERDKNGNFKSFIDFCERVKPDKKTIEALLYSNCFSDIEPHPKKWENIIEYLCLAISDIKKDKKLNLMDTVKKYIHKDIIKQDDIANQLVAQKRAIEGYSKASKEIREKIDQQIQDRHTKLLDNVESKLMEAHTGFSKVEIRDNEIKYLSYQLTTNPENIFSKYAPKFVEEFSYLEIDTITPDMIGDNITLVGKIKGLKEIVTKRTKEKMAFTDLSLNGNTIGLTFFASQWKELNNIKDGDFIKLSGKLQENRDKEFGEYNVIVNKLNILDCISTEDIYIQDISNFTSEDMKTYKKILDLLTNLCHNKNIKIQKILAFKKGEKTDIAKAKYWIGDLSMYREMLTRYNLVK